MKLCSCALRAHQKIHAAISYHNCYALSHPSLFICEIIFLTQSKVIRFSCCLIGTSEASNGYQNLHVSRCKECFDALSKPYSYSFPVAYMLSKPLFSFYWTLLQLIIQGNSLSSKVLRYILSLVSKIMIWIPLRSTISGVTVGLWWRSSITVLNFTCRLALRWTLTVVPKLVLVLLSGIGKFKSCHYMFFWICAQLNKEQLLMEWEVQTFHPQSKYQPRKIFQLYLSFF